MFPFIDLLGHQIQLFPLIVLFCFVAGFVWIWHFFRSRIGALRTIGVYLITCAMGLIGARLFHVFWERPELLSTAPQKIFTEWTGLTFYGSIIGGLLSLVLFSWKWIPRKAVADLWDHTAILVAFAYGFMRFGCFANGCCWGKLCTLPWAVTYFHPHSLMPYKGVPVHPVQLYDALIGWGIGIVLFILWRRRHLRGSLSLVFLSLYALGRLATENFRGDSYRGVDLAWGLSTSQWISLFLLMAVFASAVMLHAWRLRIWRRRIA